jgi:carbonic anhydrase
MKSRLKFALAATAAGLILGSPVMGESGRHAPRHAAPAAEAEDHEPAGQHAPAAPRPIAVHAVHWSYEGDTGPEHWAELSPEYSQCGKGHMQSPIDLGVSAEVGQFKVGVAYRPGPLTIFNNGHTIQVNFPEGSMLTSGISRYKLLQVHFHTPSESTLYGIHYPMTAHFVHIDYAGNLAVLGVMFEDGPTNPELEKIIKAAPHYESLPFAVPGVTFDPAKLLPANLAVFRYEGSLTTPPCTEGVRWHEATHTVKASASQIAALQAIMGDNARPIQPLYGRLLVKGAD